MRYFVKLRQYPQAEDVGRPLVVVRIDDGLAEKFDHENRQWVEDDDLLWRVMGLGGDADFEPIDKVQADSYVKDIKKRMTGTAVEEPEQKGGPGSGYYGHAGRFGLVGGSAPPGETQVRLVQAPAMPIEQNWIINKKYNEDERKLIGGLLYDEIMDGWPKAPPTNPFYWTPEELRKDRAINIGTGAAEAFLGYYSTSDLLVRRERGELVGIAAISEDNYTDSLNLDWLATREKGNGTIMMIEIAREALRRHRKLQGFATPSAVNFYMGLADAVGVGAEIDRSGSNMVIGKDALIKMLDPLKDLKGPDDALNFAVDFMQAEDETGAWFFVPFDIKGGEGSGHPGHHGRPGRRGGSLPRGAAMVITDKWYGPRVKEKARRELVEHLKKELRDTWPRYHDVERKRGETYDEWWDRQNRAETAYSIAQGSIQNFAWEMSWRTKVSHLLVRREKGQLVGVGSLTVDPDEPYAYLSHLATREKGNGSIMMINMARRAVAKRKGLTGQSLLSAETFYRGLADAMQVGHLIEGHGTSMKIPLRALKKMLEPLKDLKEKKEANPALDFVLQFMEDEDDIGIWFGEEEPLENVGGEQKPFAPEE